MFQIPRTFKVVMWLALLACVVAAVDGHMEWKKSREAWGGDHMYSDDAVHEFEELISLVRHHMRIAARRAAEAGKSDSIQTEHVRAAFQQIRIGDEFISVRVVE